MAYNCKYCPFSMKGQKKMHFYGRVFGHRIHFYGRELILEFFLGQEKRGGKLPKGWNRKTTSRGSWAGRFGLLSGL